MQVQIKHDRYVPGDKNPWITQAVEGALERFGDQLTRVDVHLADEDGPKRSEGAIRCTIEARPAGFDPIAVTAHGSDVGTAVEGALDKLERRIDDQLERVRAPRANL